MRRCRHYARSDKACGLDALRSDPYLRRGLNVYKGMVGDGEVANFLGVTCVATEAELKI